MIAFGRHLPNRLPALALSGLICLCAQGRTAHAGCHVADRPTLAFLFETSEERAFPAPSATETYETPQVAPLPCRDETPQGSVGVKSPVPSALPVFRGGAGSMNPSVPLDRSDPQARSVDRSSRLDRPPRDASID